MNEQRREGIELSSQYKKTQVVPQKHRAGQYSQLAVQPNEDPSLQQIEDIQINDQVEKISLPPEIPKEITCLKDFKKLRNPKELNFKLIDTKNKFVTEYYAGLEQDNQKIGFGTLFKINNKTDYEYYEGEFVLNYYHGVGFLITAKKGQEYPQGSKDEFFKGVRKSDFFKGQIKNGALRDMRSKSFEKELKSGYYPKIYDRDGIRKEYYGQLEGVNRHNTEMNMGMYVYPNKYIYIGQFKNEYFDGIGRIVFENGNYYEGEWKEGQKSGFGEYVWKIQERYDLQLKEKFIGEYKYDQKVKGIYEWIDQVKYCGGFKNDLMDGYALLIQKHGKSILTQWDKGIKIGQEKEEEINPNSQSSNQQMPFMGKQGS